MYFNLCWRKRKPRASQFDFDDELSFLYNVGTFDSEPLRYSHDVTAHHVSRYVSTAHVRQPPPGPLSRFCLDRAGRKLMIMSMYTLSGILLAITGSLSLLGALGCWDSWAAGRRSFFSPPQPRQPPI